MWELLHIGRGSRDEHYRSNLCTKPPSLLQPGLALVLARMACMKRASVYRSDELSWKNPELP